MFCPNCGMENPDTALECRRCHMEFTDDDRAQVVAQAQAAQGEAAPPEAAPPEAAAEAGPPSLGADEEEATTVDPVAHPPAAAPEESFGTVCRRCEAFNEPGVARCTNCGYSLQAEPEAAAPAASPAAPHEDPGGEDRTPPTGNSLAAEAALADEHGAFPDTTPPTAQPSLSDELQALAISDEDARDAQNGDQSPADATPPEGLAPVQVPEEEAAPPPRPPPAAVEAPPSKVKPAAVAPPPAPKPPPPAPPPAPPPPAVPADKACDSCGAVNPPNAKFCAECGTPFKKAAKPAPKPAPGEDHATDPSTHRAGPPAADATSEQAPVEIGEPAAQQDTEAVAALPAEEEVPPAAVEEEAAPAAAEPVQARVDDYEQMPSAEDLAAIEAARLARKAAAARSYVDEPPAIEIAPELAGEELPAEEAAAPAEEAPAQEAPAEELPPAELAAEEVPAEAAEAPLEEAPAELPPEEPIEELSAPLEEPPFPAQLTVERGAAVGTLFPLAQLENTLGGPEATIPLGDDPHLAPVHATVSFEDQKLVVRDAGTANGVYLKIREPAPLAPGDTFIAGERLFRYDGPVELPAVTAGDPPLQGSPRPQGASVRVVELLGGGRSGRTCHRAGPVVSIGKTGCDLNFPADTLLGARHAELHLGEGGEVSVHDLGAAPGGVLVRLHAGTVHELQAGDVLQLGNQVLRVDVG